MLKQYRETVYENALRRRNGGGGAPPFSPIDITGLNLWLDAADSSTITGTTPVTQWRDKSGGGAILNSTGSPTLTTVNGLQSIFLNGSSHFSSALGFAKLFGGTYASWFAVANVTNASTANYGTIIGTNYSTANSSVDMYINSGQLMNFFRKSLYVGGGPSGSTTPGTSISIALPSGSVVARTSVNLTAGTYDVFANGSGSASSGGPTGIFDSQPMTLQVGWDGYPGQTKSIGTFSECLLFTTALTTLQVQQVEGYLAWKWGLQAKLPAGHPYKLAPP